MQKANRGRAKAYDADNLMFRSILGIVFIALGIISAISIVGGSQGVVFKLIQQAMQGLGGGLCLGVSVFLIWGGALVAFSARHKAPVRAILFIMLLYICALGILNLLSKIGETSLMEYAIAYNRSAAQPIPNPGGYWEVIRAGFAICGASGYFGGAIGMLTAWPMATFVGTTGGVVLLGAISLICLLFCTKFDFVGIFQHARESSDAKMEHREIEKQRKEIEKQRKKQQEEEQKQQDSLLRPAYIRKQEKEAKLAAKEQDMRTAPMQGEPTLAYAGGVFPQQAQPFATIPNLPVQQTIFMPNPQASGATMYDEMIVPEVPDGGTASNWKVKFLPGKRNNGTAGTVQAQPAPQAPGYAIDREAEKVVERMEANRLRKEQIAREISELGYTAPPTADTAQGATRDGKRTDTAVNAPPARGNTPQSSVDSRQPANIPVTAGQGQTVGAGYTPALNAAQRAYANQTAAYQPPQPVVPQQNTGAPVTDRFEAYKKPAGAERGMAGNSSASRQASGKHASAADEKQPYPYPMIELLNLQTQVIPDTRDIDRINAAKLEQTLESFGIPARVQRVTHGPAVTRFELGLVSSGINVKRIMNIADNIALDMAANGGVRIEVPIPGTNLFGVEIPNSEIISVSLAEVLTSPEMTNAKSPLSIALGKDIAGRPIICDLAKMPHLLIAGQTGSGKSVCINAIINSLLYRSTPDEVRMIMIDPKVVELQGYNKVPHLLIPVVSDPHKAAGALAWAVQEMLDRYHKMQSKGVREITAYNAKVVGDEPKLPRIVIIIDELSDLMLACKKEVEESIIRLAQLARAAGIHVVVATQRPTVNVITGLIKANIPSRIAFAVASSIDSRTILDMNGAEKLLGKGDMFYFPTGDKAPLRVQGCFLSDAEINNVVDYIAKNSDTDYDERINEIMEAPDALDADAVTAGTEDSENDNRLQEAVEMVLADGQASISMLQRRMKIGYARAGRLIDEMAARGIVSKSAGSKPREVLISYDQYLQQQDVYLR